MRGPTKGVGRFGKNRFLILLLSGAIFTGGCGAVNFSYGNPVTGNVGSENPLDNYESVEDFEKDLEEKILEEELKQEAEELLSDVPDGELATTGNKKVDGYKVGIAGGEYDLRSSGKELIGEMVKNGMIVLSSSGATIKLFDENGDLSDIMFINPGTEQEGYNEKGHPEKYFNGDDLKKEYQGKVIYADIRDIEDRPASSCNLFLDFLDHYGNDPTKFKTPDGYTEKSSSKDLNDKTCLQMGPWAPQIANCDTKYGSLFVDGEQVDLSVYRNRVDQLMKEHEFESLVDLTKYMLEDLASKGATANGRYLYGTFTAYELDNPSPSALAAIDTEEHKNCAALNLALCDAYEKMDAGEVENITTYSLGWSSEGKKPATLYMTVITPDN